MRKACLGFALLAAGCAANPMAGAVQDTAGAAPASDARKAVAAPAADHHQHLWSASATAFVSTPPLPAIELPAPLAALLKERAERTDPAALASLYTQDALRLDPGGAIFLRGRDEAAGRAAASGGRFRMLPVAYKIDGPAGYIAGTFVDGTGASTRHVADFLLSLQKDRDGAWRIAAESVSDQEERVSPREITGDQLVAQLDDAGIRRAVVLSVAYFYGSAFLPEVADEYARLRAENDWVGAQVARHPDRLVGFCGLNPLKPYAIEELTRCARHPHLKGLKLHFANSGVDVRKPEHVEKLRQLFRAANDLRMPIVAHVWVPGKAYGREHSQLFLTRVLPVAPDIAIQIAHLAGTGPGYNQSYDQALSVFAEAVEAGDPSVRNLYFDVASNVSEGQSAETRTLVAQRLRQLGLGRMLFGSDSGTANMRPAAAWEAFRQLPLTDEEFGRIAGNVAPYLR